MMELPVRTGTPPTRCSARVSRSQSQRNGSLRERERHARVASGLSESGYRCVRLRADGNPIDVVMSMSPVRDRGGRVIGVASISRPLSDQESADARFASLLEAAPDAMVCVNASGLITLINAQVTAVFGYSREELIGASLEVLVPDEIRDRHPQHRAAFLQDPKPRPMGTGLALRGRHADGSTFPVEVSLAADVHNGDAIVIAAIRDVTEQRATEAALRDNETRLRQLADNVDTVFTMRQIHPPKFLYVSPRVPQAHGLRTRGDRSRSGTVPQAGTPRRSRACGAIAISLRSVRLARALQNIELFALTARFDGSARP